MNQLITLPSLAVCAVVSTLGYIFLSKANVKDAEEEKEKEIEFDPLHELTDENFKNLIAEAKAKKQMLFFDIYAPWCGWCKKMADEWKQLAEEYKDNESMKVLTIDGSTNPIAKEHFSVKTFPTLVLYNGKTNKYHKYKGERTVEDFKNFINKRK